MSSPGGCPPQLHLSLANTTSFKRSFEQFGVDLESPIGSTPGSSVSAGESRPGTGSGSASDGNDRKRARSEGSSSSSGTDISLSTSEMPSSSGDTSGLTSDAGSAASHSVASSPAHSPLSGILAQGDSETMDVEIVDSSLAHPTEDLSNWTSAMEESVAPSAPTNSQHYGEVLERIHAFESEISALRRSPSTSLPPELPPIRPASPPVLPPIVVEDEYTLGPLSGSAEPASPSRPPFGMYERRPRPPFSSHANRAEWLRTEARSQFGSDRFANARRNLATPRMQDEDCTYFVLIHSFTQPDVLY